MSSQRPIGGGAGTPDRLNYAKAVAKARATELTDVRAAASKWQAGLAALTGGITLFGIIKSRSDLSSLRNPYPALAGLLLATGLALSIAGGLFALRAANGMPQLFTTSTLDLETDDHRRAVSARKHLRAAVFSAIASLVAFAAALAIVWFAPKADGPRLKVIPTDGDTACGSVTSISGTTLVLKTSDGSQSFDLTKLRGLSPVGTCS
jgi:hypothetical protein